MTKMYVKINNVTWGWEKIDLIKKQFHLFDNYSEGGTNLSEAEIKQIKKPLSLSFFLDKEITIGIYVNPKIVYNYKFKTDVMECDYYLCKLTYSGLHLIKKEKDVILREGNGIGNDYNVFNFFSENCLSFEDKCKIKFFEHNNQTLDEVLRDLDNFYNNTSSQLDDYTDSELDDDVYCNPAIMNQFWK